MDEIPEAFWLGVEQFNQRQFYDCHDTLEAIWTEAETSDKNFYQGILQVAVALYHLRNLNWQGAVVLMGEGVNRLRAYQPEHYTIDVEQFLADTVALLRDIQQAGPEAVAAIAQRLETPDPDRPIAPLPHLATVPPAA